MPFTTDRLIRRAVGAAGLTLVLFLGAAAAPLPAPSVREVLARLADYSESYGEALASVVADEHFEQQLVSRRDGSVVDTRRLESEIAFVTLAGTSDWLAFRNVVRVDGGSLPDAAGQLERLFRDTPRSALGQARALTAESARYNLGPVQRNFNVPTTVLQFVLRQHQDRFRFRKIAEERVADETVWIIEFREQDRATFIRTPQGRAAPAQGRLWVTPGDGRVIRSRLIVKSEVTAAIDVVWQYDRRLALWVPAEMREHYQGPWTTDTPAAKRDAYDVHGLARYSNYRRFDVDIRILR